MVRREGQCLYHRRLGGREMSGSVVGKVGTSNYRIDSCQADHRLDIFGIERPPVQISPALVPSIRVSTPSTKLYLGNTSPLNWDPVIVVIALPLPQ
jgi:hypothetical protein